MIKKIIDNNIKWHDKENSICDEDYSYRIVFLGIRIWSKKMTVKHDVSDIKSDKQIGYK